MQKRSNLITGRSTIDAFEEISLATATGNWAQGEVFQPKSEDNCLFMIIKDPQNGK